MEACPQAPCQFWNTWAWQSMIIQDTRPQVTMEKRCALRGAELFHVELEQALNLAVDRQELAVEVDEVSPLRIAVAHCQRVRTPVERIARIDHVGPAFVVL